MVFKTKEAMLFDLEKQEALKCEEINELSDQHQADKLVDHFLEIRGRFDPLISSDIKIPYFDQSSIPHISQFSVLKELKQIKVKKAIPPGDIPSRILK